MLPLVQPRSIALLFLATALHAAETPDPHEILRAVRVAQGTDGRTLTGRLRTGPKKTPFKLTMQDGAIRWEFQDPAQTLVLRLGEKSSSLEEITANGKGKVSGARYDDPVRDTGITYEDLAMRFLYWSNATVEGEQTILLTKCWQILVTPGGSPSTYSKVRLWIGKDSPALLKCEAFGRDGKLARTFRVISGQKSKDGLWLLKQMRIEAAAGGLTYLEIDPVE